MPQTSSKLTRVTLEADKTIDEGSIRVFNIYVANGSNAPSEVVFTNRDGTPILNMMIPPLDSEQFNGTWIADKGLKVLGLSSVTVIVTVLHGQPGA